MGGGAQAWGRPPQGLGAERGKEGLIVVPTLFPLIVFRTSPGSVLGPEMSKQTPSCPPDPPPDGEMGVTK